jgi:hypothetical protein
MSDDIDRLPWSALWREHKGVVLILILVIGWLINMELSPSDEPQPSANDFWSALADPTTTCSDLFDIRYRDEPELRASGDMERVNAALRSEECYSATSMRRR